MFSFHSVARTSGLALFTCFCTTVRAATLHAIQLDDRVLLPEDGLLLGNGDLSVSIYQTADRIIWRFGKNDVWDRRLDLSDDPKPAHINEIARGIRDEGWKCGPYGNGKITATRGTRDPKRMREICQGTPPSYKRRPYPCPKPVGELSMHLPPDWQGMRIHQRLEIESATIDITCSWPTGPTLRIECFIPPSPNVLVVRWKMDNWNDVTRTGHDVPPVWFALERWADPPIREFANRFFAEYRHGGFRTCCDPKASPLPPPKVATRASLRCIEQDFQATPLFPAGFRYLLAPFAPEAAVASAGLSPGEGACLHIMPHPDASEGALAVTVTTSSDPGGPEKALDRVRAIIRNDFSAALRQWTIDNKQSAREFWSKSSLQIADPLIEGLWYETFHARRCTYRADTPPPGLFLPSTVQDYSHWHGDYHTNYNYQAPYWGDYTANHLELGDAWFEGIKYFLQIGRKIARDYYDCRGVFIQLSGFPIQAKDDPLGVAPMGRMAYMTGWAMIQYWRRYLYTLDRDWLRTTGYPVIRDCALFYTDFLKKGPDGLYHAFPSNQGEDGFSGNPKDYTDRRQVIEFARYSLRAAIRASSVLDTDGDLRRAWQERLDRCAPPDGRLEPERRGLDKWCAQCNPPEFGLGRPWRGHQTAPGPSPYAAPKNGRWRWYFGQFPWELIRHVRQGDFVPDRDYPAVRRLVRRWRHPNGLVWAMAAVNYGHCGAWTETLGVMAPFQEMMLQSWDGSLRIFPAWPTDVDARFTNLRAQGAFLVSASWSKGKVRDARIFSEKEGRCCLTSPWPGGMKVVGPDDRSVVLEKDAFGRPCFRTRPGLIYRLLEPGD